MANFLNKNPWTIDTPSANYLRSGTTTPAPAGLAGTGYAGKGPMWISAIQWVGTVANTDTATITDENGQTWVLNAHTDKSVVELNFDQPLRKWDLAVTQLSSGRVLINLV